MSLIIIAKYLYECLNEKHFVVSTLRPGFLPILKLPIHMSVSNIWLQVWAMKSRCLAATASFRQVELLQLTSSYVKSFMATCSSCL